MYTAHVFKETKKPHRTNTYLVQQQGCLVRHILHLISRLRGVSDSLNRRGLNCVNVRRIANEGAGLLGVVIRGIPDCRKQDLRLIVDRGSWYALKKIVIFNTMTLK